MIVRFAVENYNSFKSQQVFSMVAGKQTRHPSHCMHIEGKRLLKSSFFFGANASGKSNFVRALDFMRRMVLSGTSSKRYYDRFFRIDSSYKNKPGVFQIDFISEKKVYSYGFVFDYLQQVFRAEWLYRVESSEREICIFEREHGKPIETKLPFKKNSSSELRFRFSSEDLKANALFLSDIGNKDLPDELGFSDFKIAYEWFKKLIVVFPESIASHKNEFFLNPAFNTSYMVEMLRDFDTGIESIKKGKQLAEKALDFLPEELKIHVLSDLEVNLRKSDKKNPKGHIEIGKHYFEFSLEDGEIYAEKIMLDHGNPSELFELSDESDGTKRLFDLIPLYEMGQNEKVIIIDELDRSFHSKLTREFIRRFYEVTNDKLCQLICTTHDLNLMDLQILRQDEIWFVEREEDHSSRIYSLSDYQQRFDKNILNDYLIGRYGAIPYFRNSEW